MISRPIKVSLLAFYSMISSPRTEKHTTIIAPLTLSLGAKDFTPCSSSENDISLSTIDGNTTLTIKIPAIILSYDALNRISSSWLLSDESILGL